MRTRSLVISATLISALVLALAVIAGAADNPFVGTWKMNPAKTKSSNPAFKSYLITYSAQESVYKGFEDIVDADGKAFQRSWTGKCDGKEFPVTAPDVDMLSCTQPNANTVDFVCKKNGKVLWSGRTVISKDGKTQINKGGGKDEKGKAFTYSLFLEKQ
jgi:hypothetical protein